MADAFISYRRKPSGALAQLIQEKLKNKHGLDAYVDTTRADSTHVQFPDRLMQAIADTPAFVCLLGDTTLESEWVHKEIQRAYELRKHCIPVFQESYVPPAAPDEAVTYLLNFDGVHIFDVKSVFVDEAIAQMAALIRGAVKLSKPSRRFPAWLPVGAILTVVLVVLVMAVSLLNPPSGSAEATLTAANQLTETATLLTASIPANSADQTADAIRTEIVRQKGTMDAIMTNIGQQTATLDTIRTAAATPTATADVYTDTPTPTATETATTPISP